MCPDCGKPVSQSRNLGKKGFDSRLALKSGVGASEVPGGRVVLGSLRLLPEELHCVCNRNKRVSKSDGIIRVGRETKGRKGKGVTIITGLPLGLDKLQDLARELKQKCGSGGTVKDGVIEIQGDHRDLVVAELRTKGYAVTLSGG